MSKTSQPSQKNKRTISLRQQVRNLLKKCEINPTEPGPWQTIAETAGAEYLEHRAMEEVQRAIRSLKTEMSPSLHDFKLYEQHLVAATELLTLARLKRKTYLLDDKFHVCIVTQLGLVEGDTSKVIEERRLAVHKGQYQPMVPGILDTSKVPVVLPSGKKADKDYKIPEIKEVVPPTIELCDFAKRAMERWLGICPHFDIIGDHIKFKDITSERKYVHTVSFCENEKRLFISFDDFICGTPCFNIIYNDAFERKVVTWLTLEINHADQRLAQEERKKLDEADRVMLGPVKA